VPSAPWGPGQVRNALSALLEGPEAIHLNGGKVGKYVAAAALWLNEAKAFGVVEPFHSANGFHRFPPLALFRLLLLTIFGT
jgi:hypothetical protein